MPTIPQATQIQRVIPTGQAPVATIPNPGAVGQAMVGLGRGVADVGVAIDNKSRYDATNAEEEFISRKMQADQEADDDTDDYSTLPQRYAEKLQKAKDEIASKLNPAAARYFSQRADVHLDRGVTRSKGVSIAKEHKYETSNIENRLDRLADSAAIDPDLDATSQVAHDMLDSAIGQGYLIKPDADRVFKEWKDKVVERKLKMMTPEQRLEVTNQEWFKQNVPPDRQVAIALEAAEQTRQVVAQTSVEKWRAAGLRGSAIETKINAESDPKLRDMLRLEADQADARAHRDQVQTQASLVDKWYPLIARGDVKISGIPDNEWKAMGSGVGSLLNAELGLAGAIGSGMYYPKHTAMTAIDTMHALLDGPRKDPVAARKFFSEHRNEFSEPDYQSFSKAIETGSVPPEVKTSISLREYITNKAGPRLKSRIPDVWMRADDWVREWQAKPANQGKELPVELRNKMVDSFFIERETPWYQPGTTRNLNDPNYVPPKTLDWAGVQAVAKDKAEALRKLYPNATEQELVDEYNAREAAASSTPGKYGRTPNP